MKKNSTARVNRHRIRAARLGFVRMEFLLTEAAAHAIKVTASQLGISAGDVIECAAGFLVTKSNEDILAAGEWNRHGKKIPVGNCS